MAKNFSGLFLFSVLAIASSCKAHQQLDESAVKVTSSKYGIGSRNTGSGVKYMAYAYGVTDENFSQKCAAARSEAENKCLKSRQMRGEKYDTCETDIACRPK